MKSEDPKQTCPELEQTQALTVVHSQPLAAPMAPMSPLALDIGALIKAVVDKGVTGENVEAMKSLVGLYEHMEDRNAEREYNTAFAQLMKEMPKVQATKAVPNDDGTTRYVYAPFEEIDEQLRPIAMRYGFTYSFKEGDSKPGSICKICVVRHIGGHKEENPYSCRIGAGPPKTTDSQKDGSAHTYAKRGALCDAFNIVVMGQDDDARDEGDNISADQAKRLKERVKATGSNEARFLKFAGAETFEQIKTSRYAELDELLHQREDTK